jgi:hypothetical protein
VRSALAAVGEQLPDRERGNRDEPLSAEQMALLERFAVVAMGSMRRANHALDRAFEAADATKAHLAKTKRMRASVAG